MCKTSPMVDKFVSANIEHIMDNDFQLAHAEGYAMCLWELAIEARNYDECERMKHISATIREQFVSKKYKNIEEFERALRNE